MEKITSIIISFIILSSCSTYKATIRQHEDLDYGAMKVTPEWEYIDHKGSKKLIRGIGLISGGIYGYTNETTINGKTYTGFQNAAPWGIIGYIGGAIITSVIFQKENPNKATFNISQSDKWLNEFNQSTGNSYLLNSKNLDNTLVLIPQSNVEVLRYEYKLLEEDLKRSSPTTNFQTLKNWEIKLTKEFSYLPADELSNLKSLISENKQKLADKELKVYAKEIEQLANEEESLATIERLRRNSQDLYYAASYDGQIEYKNTMQEKIGKILNIIVSDEQKKLSAYGNELVDLETINSSIPAIDKKFSDYKGNSDVDNYYMLLNSKVSNLLKFNRTKIENAIKGTDSQKQLSSLQAMYLSNVKTSDETTLKLEKLFKSRSIEIKNEELRLIALKERQRKLGEERLIKLHGFSLNTDGLVNQDLIINLFKGNFEDIPFYSDDQYFLIIISSYMYAQSKKCYSSLPSDKVEIYDIECVETTQEEDYWSGLVINEYCSEYDWRPQGSYTSPRLFEAFKTIREINFNERGRIVWGKIKQMNTSGFDGINNMALDVKSIESDINELFDLNSCTNKALKRFEENLIRFALNQPPIQLDGSVKTYNIDYSKNHDFKSLINDLIYENSRDWTLNRYINNSVGNVRILSRDNQNRPLKIRAEYNFEGLLGRQQYWVNLTFNEGIPACLFFQDYPNTCRTADRAVVKDFINGKYIK